LELVVLNSKTILMKNLMYKTFLVTLVCIFSGITAQGQDDSGRMVYYRTWVLMRGETDQVKGYLYDLKDSSLVVSRSVVIDYSPMDEFNFENIYYNDISSIKVRKKGRVWKSLVIGTGAGFAFGSLVGLIFAEDDPPPQGFLQEIFWRSKEDKILMIGFTCSSAGLVTGGLIGSVKIDIPIAGNHNFSKQAGLS